MKKAYKYCLLKYRHSYFLGEVINIGLLFYSQDAYGNNLQFLYPKKLQRLSNLYPDIQLPLIRKFQEAFASQALKLDKNTEIKNNLIDATVLKSIIQHHFIKDDSTALFFDGITEGVSTDIETTRDFIFKTYFECYEGEKLKDRKDEKYVIDKVKEKFKEYTNSEISKLKVDVVLGIKDSFKETFEYGWENGTLNLIAPVSFDLTRENNIEHKAYLWNGKLNALSENIRGKNARIDIITAPPQSRNLIPTYKLALKVISQASASHEIIEEDEIPSYVQSLAKYI